MRYITVSDARNALPSLTDSTERTVLTRNGRPIAVLLNIDEFRSIQATLSLVSEPGRLARVMTLHENVQNGDTSGFKELEELGEKKIRGHTILS